MGQEAPPLSPRPVLTPECLSTGGPELDGESRGDKYTLGHPWVPLGHSLVPGPAMCSACHLRASSGAPTCHSRLHSTQCGPRDSGPESVFPSCLGTRPGWGVGKGQGQRDRRKFSPFPCLMG